MAAASSSAVPLQMKKKRNQPGTPSKYLLTIYTSASVFFSNSKTQDNSMNPNPEVDPDVEVIALSPKSLMATNRFICEVCNKGFQREQNLQLHRRGHNLPWKLKQKTNKEVKKKVYLCPEPTCVHHEPARALGDLTGIKKHYSRKHGEKKWKCEKCSKRYAVQSDWKAHSKTCGTKEYRCDCGTLFSRRDSFITHRAFCDALAQGTTSNLATMGTHHLFGSNHHQMSLGLSHVQAQHQPLSNMLRLGGGGAAKLEHLIGSTSNPSSLQNMPGSAFFMADAANQGFHQDHHGNGPYMNKPFHGLMQLPDLQGNTNNSGANSANLFNLGFFPNNDGSSGMSAGENGTASATNLSSSGFLSSNQFNMGDEVGSGLSSLYSTTSMQHENISPNMSATALLQKAAQMGSTTSNNTSSLLRGIGSSSSSGVKSDRQVFAANFGGGEGGGGETLRSQMENDNNNLQGLLNSLAKGNSSIFGAGHGQDQSNFVGGFTGSGMQVEHHVNNTNFSNVNEANKFAASIGGTDKLTLDFLGVGEIVRNISGAGQHGINIGSLNPEMKSSAQATSQQFGGAKLV
ncbi:Protein indeterminate-domain 6 [Hibiscus syriacus]|uniref:Protein indeterminate-domain 6 n=2 Tax=Hibiscus syriacus TaxID=106335 RepID=A0A6A3D8N4_HIBSY|nr:Protein indeterminate-domain 6 [Hibiscus syriacus]